MGYDILIAQFSPLFPLPLHSPLQRSTPSSQPSRKETCLCLLSRYSTVVMQCLFIGIGPTSTGFWNIGDGNWQRPRRETPTSLGNSKGIEEKKNTRWLGLAWERHLISIFHSRSLNVELRIIGIGLQSASIRCVCAVLRTVLWCVPCLVRQEIMQSKVSLCQQ